MLLDYLREELISRGSMSLIIKRTRTHSLSLASFKSYVIFLIKYTASKDLFHLTLSWIKASSERRPK